MITILSTFSDTAHLWTWKIISDIENFLIKKGSLMQPAGRNMPCGMPQQQETKESRWAFLDLVTFLTLLTFLFWTWNIFTQILDLENFLYFENFLIKKGSQMQPTGSTPRGTPQQQETKESHSTPPLQQPLIK
jgi:hypothetical protein